MGTKYVQVDKRRRKLKFVGELLLGEGTNIIYTYIMKQQSLDLRRLLQAYVISTKSF